MTFNAWRVRRRNDVVWKEPRQSGPRSPLCGIAVQWARVPHIGLRGPL